MPRYFLGVDGGQSSTTALIGDESGVILGRAVAGPCNHVAAREAVERFRRVVSGCVADACYSANLQPRTTIFTAACLGFSGGAEDKEQLTRELIRSERYYITHDGEIALAGAFDGEPGIIVISGTGSFAFGKNASGASARAGGWGYIIGDEGGAFDMVRRALRAALQFEEGWGRPGMLHGLLLENTGAASAQELLHAIYTPEWPRSRVAQLARLVTAAAESGDQVARGILQEAAAKLAWYAQGVYSKLFVDPAPVSPIGGTFQSEPLRSAFEEAVRNAIGCPVVPARLDPAAGALRMARNLPA
jgi:N-acetylglucosamine kinase-like BadF-type ATPase